MAIKRYYGGDTQTFEIMRKRNFVYVDKTELVYNLTHDHRFVFLSRPRRFGKSLLCTTLKSYFEGRQDLFKGLAIENLENEWTKYPVLHFNMSNAKDLDKDALESFLSDKLSEYEKEYNITPQTPYSNIRLTNLIKTAYAQENQEVVIIIDEYDAPLLEVVHDDEKLKVIRQVMRNFYSPLKACDEYLHFVFLTGITKFSQLSIFSELNNLDNISMDPEYAAICGITEDELLSQLSIDIDNLAEAQGLTREQTITELKKMYDGYHFTWPSPDIYNPFSLIKAFSKKALKSFWFESGTPTYLVEMMKKLNVLPTDIYNVKAYAEDFDAPTNQIDNIIPLFYQSGYITIKKCLNNRYTLDIPNKEVRDGLMRTLLPYYVTPDLKIKAKNTIGDMEELINADDMDGALKKLQTFLLGVPYPTFIKSEQGNDPEESKRKKITDYEGYYQQHLYVIFSMLGCCQVHKEEAVANGRIDLTLETDTRIYVIELKIYKSAKTVKTAISQMDEKKYTAKYSSHPLPVYKLAITFDVKTHTLKDWLLQPAN